MSAGDRLSVTAKPSNLRFGITVHITEAWAQNIFLKDDDLIDPTSTFLCFYSVPGKKREEK